MRDATLIALLLALLSSSRLTAQQPAGPKPVQPARPLELPTLRPPTADTGIFSPLPFLPANEVRRANGAPGRAYWQQRVDYTIRATLDTATKRISGSESIRYSNNSPDTLRFIWMQMDQNLFRPGSTGALLFASESRFGGAGFKGGFEIERVTQCGAAGPQGSGAAKLKPESRTKRSRTRPAPAPLPCYEPGWTTQ